MSDDIVYNAIRTPDGTVLESRHRHDFRSYTDKNGMEYFVDGGCEYCRRGWTPNAPEPESLLMTLEDPHEEIREVLTWGTYGPDGDQPYRQVLLKDMTNEHIEACLETQDRMYPQVRQAMKNELEYRQK